MNAGKRLTDGEVSEVESVLSSAQTLIQEIEEERKSKLLVFYCHTFLSYPVGYLLHKVLRRMGSIANLDVLLDSGGGDINAAYKIIRMFKSYATKTTIMVPFFAKSAASLIAIGTDELIMCKGGELGPIDPQVMDPFSGRSIPAHSLKESLAFIEETKDPLVRVALADKIPPLLMGSYREAGTSTKQYLEEICSKFGDKKEDVIKQFTERFLSHGYPMDRELLKSIGVMVSYPPEDLEGKISDLYEKYADLSDRLSNAHPIPGEILIIQSNDKYHVDFGDTRLISGM